MATQDGSIWVDALVRSALGGDEAADDLDATLSLLTPAQRTGDAPLPDPLPATPALRRHLLPSLDALAPEHRRALLIAAVSIGDRTEVLAAASGLPASKLFGPAFAGLLDFVARHYRIADPRLRQVVHEAASVAERSDAHERLADTHTRLGTVHAAAWHQSLAALDGRPEVVPRLLGLSRSALLRGDSVFAYRVAREAASQSEPGRLRTLAQLRCGLAALHSGYPREAREWLGAVLRSGDVVLETSALPAYVFAVATAVGHVPHADLDRLERAADGDDRALRRGLVLGLATAAALHAERGDTVSATRFGERASRVAERVCRLDPSRAADVSAIVAGTERWVQTLSPSGPMSLVSPVPPVGDEPERDATAQAGLAIVRAVRRLHTRDVAEAREAAHDLRDSILSLAPLDREASHDVPARGSATPLVEAHLRVTLSRAERAAGLAPSFSPSDPTVARLPLHLPFGGDTDGAHPESDGVTAPATRHLGERSTASSRGHSTPLLGERHPASTPGHGTPHLHAVPPHTVTPSTALSTHTQAQTQTQTQPQTPAQRPTVPHTPAPTPPPPHDHDIPHTSHTPHTPWDAALTAREAEVARLVVGGASNREISERMHLSVRTVEVHLGRVFQKLDVHSRTQLSLLVHRGGYVETRS